MSESERSGHDWLTFLSDYGLEDVFVGVCKGTIAQIAPHARIIDVCHQVVRHDVEQAATILGDAMEFLPRGVHLALVDPIVGGTTRGIVVETTDGSFLVGPDNGLLSRAWQARGGITRAVAVENPSLWRETVHATFRGRDIFAPVAAHLAAGTPIEDVGPEVSPESLTTLQLREVVVDHDHVHAEVRNVDHFGNVALNAARSDLEAAGISFGDTVELRCNGRSITVPYTHTYGDVATGRLALCEDSFRAIQLAVNAGHASRQLRVSRGEPVVISRLPQGAARSR